MNTAVQFKVYGRYALFTDPVTRVGGEKCSYQVPTYQALKGIVESIYWKPTLIWYIDKVRVMNKITTETKSMRPIRYNDATKPDLAIYTYLSHVEYQVIAHFEWNPHRPDFAKDRNENKHMAIANRMIERGGRRDIFLGTRECQGYVEPCVFGEGEGFYDDYGKLTFGMMFHGFDYPDETGINKLSTRFSAAVMDNGIIEFTAPSACSLRREIKPMNPKFFPSTLPVEAGDPV